MKSFEYVVTHPKGMEGSNLAEMVMMIKHSQSEVFITIGERKVYAANVMKIAGSGIKQGDHLIISVEGPDEDEVTEKLKQHCKDVFSK
ncbi:MAG: HPr family phosphocarrier protein [Clostridia bacterium]|nr:HPr family phosphocarrier protein [Clostridia bacterium]